MMKIETVRNLALSSFAARLVRWEPYVPLFLAFHGTALLLTGGGLLWQWAIIFVVGLLGIRELRSRCENYYSLLSRAITIFCATWFLLLSTGGVGSYFLFWYVLLILIYPLLLIQLHAIILCISVPVAYLLLYPLESGAMPLIVAVARAFLFTSIGGIGLLLKSTIYNYLAEREQVARTLERSEQYFRALIEHALDIITILNQDRTIRYISPSVKRILGYDTDDLQENPLADFVHPEDLTNVMARFFDNSNPAPPVTLTEVRMRHSDGSWSVLEVISTNLLADPIIEGIVLNARDITERKQIEEQFRQLQKMEAIGQLTTGISHDFNNLLIPIQGFAELMQRQLETDDPHHRMLEKILYSAQRAANLVRHLLAFSRKQVIEQQSVLINTIVAEMQELLRRIIGENINLQTILATDLWPVWVDPTQIEQVIVNLAVNARDALVDGGQLTIKTANALLDDQHVATYADLPAGKYVSLTISDNGSGMSDEVMAHIFEPFFTTKQPGKGTGMGLATVYGIVKQNGGHIEVNSIPGEGSSFCIYLPTADEQPHAITPTPLPDKKTSTGDETLLIVEDDIAVRGFVIDVLQAQGYHLLEAATGEEAIQIATHYTESIQLLVTDVIMPGMNGKVLAEAVRQLQPTLKILFISGYDDELISHHGVLDPGIALLQKPFGPTALARKVRDLLDS